MTISYPDIMATYLDKQFSVHVSRTLDCLGKSQDMVKYRVKINKTVNRHVSKINSPTDVIVAGSKAEGLTAVYESDHDRMFVFPCVICADKTQEFMHVPYTTLFQTERHDTPAGYTKLKQVKREGIYYNHILEQSLYRVESGHRYLSSDLFSTNLTKYFDPNRELIHLERSGPSLPSPDGKMHHDTIPAVCCVCPDILKAFITRLYNRPARNIINDISTMEGHVVPVGFKESDTSYQQWRICFTEAELHLVHSFNDSETKLYILLKMISKPLNNISKDITSYVMKNIVLWLVEIYPVVTFTEELLTTRLIQALIFFKTCVEANYLPNYIIQERNLLAGRLDQTQRRNLTTALSQLIHGGSCLLLSCDKLQVAMLVLDIEPDMAKEFKWRRDTFEKLILAKENYRLEKKVTTGCSKLQAMHMDSNDETMHTMIRALYFLILTDFDMLIRLEYSPREVSSLWRERNTQLLS